MKVTTQRKVTFGILGLAAIAFIVDRCTSSSPTPQAAHAMPVSARTPARVAASPATAAAADAGPINLETISARLEKIATADALDVSHTRDAFVASSVWKAHGEAKTEVSDRLAAAGHFRQQHKLTGVMVGRQISMISLDGKTVKAGMVVDGFRLVEVHQKLAIFEQDGIRVQLMLVDTPHGASDNLQILPARSGQSW